jgi:protein RecA
MSRPKDIASVLGSAIGGNDEESTVTQFLESGFPPLNHASHAAWEGCFPVGRISEIAGPASAGKTALSTIAMISAQKAGGIACFMDHERSFQFTLAKKLGLDTSEGRFVYKKPNTFEQSIDIFHRVCSTVRDGKLIPKTAPICFVFDSLAAMVPQSVLTDAKGKERDAKDRNMNDNTALARATSAHFPAVSMLTEEYDVATIFLNQMRNKIGVMFGDPRKTTGGDAPEFYFAQRLWLSAKQIKKGTEVIGNEVTGKFVKNKVSRPFVSASWRFMFEEDGSGRFDQERSMIDFLEGEGILEQGSKAGTVIWEGKQRGRQELADMIRSANAFDQLKALLPKAYEPKIVESVPKMTEEAEKPG